MASNAVRALSLEPWDKNCILLYSELSTYLLLRHEMFRIWALILEVLVYVAGT